jgi:hypothetical protein
MKGNSVLREAEELVRCAALPINAEYAVASFVVTSTPELTELEELQLFAGGDATEFASELQRQLTVGRIVLAICPMVHVGRGHVHFDIHIAEPYCADPAFHRYALRLVAAQLQLR